MPKDKRTFNDSTTSLEILKKRAKKFVEERNWEKYHNPKDISIALNVESSELLDLFKWKNSDEETLNESLEKIKKESADVMIFLLHLANELSIDLTKAVLEKLKENEKKYPADDSEVQDKW